MARTRGTGAVCPARRSRQASAGGTCGVGPADHRRQGHVAGPGVNRIAPGHHRLGSTPVVFAAGAAAIALAARRCRTLALVMLVTIAARGPVEWLLKELVGRPRPSGDRRWSAPASSIPAAMSSLRSRRGFCPVDRRPSPPPLALVDPERPRLVDHHLLYRLEPRLDRRPLDLRRHRQPRPRPVLASAEALIDRRHDRTDTACSSGRLPGRRRRLVVRVSAPTSTLTGRAGPPRRRSPRLSSSSPSGWWPPAYLQGLRARAASMAGAKRSSWPSPALPRSAKSGITSVANNSSDSQMCSGGCAPPEKRRSPGRRRHPHSPA